MRDFTLLCSFRHKAFWSYKLPNKELDSDLDGFSMNSPPQSNKETNMVRPSC